MDGMRAPLGYDHPIEVSVDQVTSVFGQLKYEQRSALGKTKIRRVFTAREVVALTEPIVHALKTLSPDERLRFLLARSTKSAFSTSLQGTSGVIFKSAADRVSLAFDVINGSLPTPKQGKPDNMKFSDDPTLITDASPLLPFPGTDIHSDSESGVIYPRWLEIELNTIDVVTPPQPAPPPEETTASPKEDRIRERIQSLKRLRDDGTLTQEQFDAAVQETVGEL
jgi:hypothetical protein